MRNHITFLLISAFVLPSVAAQQKVREKTESARAADNAQRRAEDVLHKAQAIDILKNVVESAADIQETQTRVAVLTGALDLLWKYDEAYTRDKFIKSATALSDRFAWTPLIGLSDEIRA